MRPVVIAAAMLGIGTAVGYAVYPLTHPAAASARDLPGTATREVVELDLTPAQLDRLAARIAPAVAQRIATPGDAKAQPDAASAQRQASAFDDAAQLVDQMIASRRVTLQGMNEARQRLADSGQADRMYEISARVSAAVNRGELTAEQAGLQLPH